MILDTARNCANYIKLVSHSPHDVKTVLGGRLPMIGGHLGFTKRFESDLVARLMDAVDLHRPLQIAPNRLS